MYSEPKQIELKPRVGIRTVVVINLCVLVQFLMLLLEIHRLGESHHLSPFIWLLPMIYPMPWIVATTFKKQVKDAVARNLMRAEAAITCSDAINIMVFVAYTAIVTIAQLHASY